jgi:hypothetical protein
MAEEFVESSQGWCVAFSDHSGRGADDNDKPHGGSLRAKNAANATTARTCGANRRRGLPPNGVDFLAKGAAGRAKLLLSRIPAASAAPIPAAP